MRLFSVVLSLLLAACNFSTDVGDASMEDAGTADANNVEVVNSMSGSLAFPIKFAGAYFRQLDDGRPDMTNASVLLLSESTPCPDPLSPLRLEAKGLVLQVYNNNTGSLEGTFDVTSAGAEIQFYQHSADGGFPTQIDSASSGTFTFSKVSTDGITGSIGITLVDGGLLAGTFNAPRCQTF